MTGQPAFEDIAWLEGYRARAGGKPRPNGEQQAEGWDDLDGLIQLIQRALAIVAKEPGAESPPT